MSVAVGNLVWASAEQQRLLQKCCADGDDDDADGGGGEVSDRLASCRHNHCSAYRLALVFGLCSAPSVAQRRQQLPQRWQHDVAVGVAVAAAIVVVAGVAAAAIAANDAVAVDDARAAAPDSTVPHRPDRCCRLQPNAVYHLWHRSYTCDSDAPAIAAKASIMVSLLLRLLGYPERRGKSKRYYCAMLPLV